MQGELTRVEHATYLPGGIFGVLHTPAPGPARDISIVMCPPFGWAEVSSYRPRRQWAIALAEAGYATLRLALPSTGDSLGAPEDPDRLGAWSATVRDAAAWLREATGCPRAAAIGIGVGGILALESGAFDELVLWSVPGRGRPLVREIQALAAVEADRQFPRGAPPPLPEGAVSAGGFLLCGETAEALRSWSLAPERLSGGHLQRALLLERDGLPVDERLGSALAEAGADVQVMPGDGYGTMFTHPQEAVLPQRVVAEVRGWLDRAASTAACDGALPEVANELTDPVAGFRERPLTLSTTRGAVRGIVTEPTDPQPGDTCLVLLNAGSVYHIGPGRMWVEVARRWASHGLRTVRLDLDGIGDADGPDGAYAEDAALYVPELSDQAIEALDAIANLDLADRFILGGLCSGAFWSFHAALRDERVRAAYLLNPRALFWSDALAPARDFRRGALRPRNWRRLGSVPRERYMEVARWVAGTPGRLLTTSRESDAVARAFDRLRESGVRVHVIFSEDEPLREELAHAGHLNQLRRWPNLTLEYVTGQDHSLRPLVSQAEAHASLDRALERDLAAYSIESAARTDDASGLISPAVPTTPTASRPAAGRPANRAT